MGGAGYSARDTAERPNADAVSRLDPRIARRRSFMVQARCLLLRRRGARPKLTNAYFDAKLKTRFGTRNWRTVNTL